MDFGGLLRAYRERGWLSQERLGERSGLSVRTIRDLERRVRRPRSESVRLLADGLGLVGRERERFEAAAHRWSPEAGQSAAQPVPGLSEVAVPCQLPPDVADFVGRAAVARQLRDLLAGRSDDTAGESDTAAVVISAVSGKAGVGKSALAVHVAHQLAADFPDGQLYASLRGAGAGAGGVSRLDPAEILGRFLRALGVDGAAIPTEVAERAALYRSRVAGRRVLVVLDDAAGEAQVRPLLPGSPGCAVLITSRARLAGLEGARLLHLEVLEAGQAVELLGRIAGPGRVAAEPDAAVAIVVACGRLPLAVRIAGARLAARPHWSLGRMADLLADERGRLDALVHGDLEVRASLSLSYRGLGQEQRRLFCRLGLLDVPDVAGWVAGALLDRPVAEAEALLEELVDAQLVDVARWDPTGRPRYRLHDLVRLFARERVHAEEPLAQRQAALERALGGWLALAEQADKRLRSNLYVSEHSGAPRWHLTAQTADALLADPLAWMEAERFALVAAVDQAAHVGFHELAWDLAGSLINAQDLRGYHDDWQHAHQAALAAARRAGDRRGEASLLRGLGYLNIHWNLSTALDYFTGALRILRQTGDRRGEASALEGLGATHRLQGEYAEATACCEQAMAIFIELGDRHSQAWTRFQIAVLHAEQGELSEARAGLEEALAAFVELGERRGVAWTQRRLGMVCAAQGDLHRAGVWLERSLAALRGLGDRATEALTLRSLGELHLRCNQRGEAQRLFQDCLVLAQDLDDTYVQALALRSLGHLHHLQADQDQASRCLKASTEIWRKLDMPLELARTLQLVGQVCLDAGSPAAAQSAWRKALVLLEPGTPEAEQVATRLELLLQTSGRP